MLGDRDGGNKELLNVYRVSVLKNEKNCGDGGNGCTTL